MTATSRRSRPLACVLATLCLVLATALIGAAAAHAAEPFGFVDGSVGVSTSTTQAGGHPDLNVRFALTSVMARHPIIDALEMPRPLETARDVVVDLPPGIVGNPGAIPRCAAADFFASSCPPESQVGVIRTNVFFIPGNEPNAVFNVVPSHGAPAEFAFIKLGLPIHMLVSVRDGDHGLRTTIANLPTQGAMSSADMTLWGVPGDPSHDAERQTSLTGEVPVRPFMTNAATCDGPTRAEISLETYDNPGRTIATTAPMAQLTGCEQQRFAATGSARPDTTKAGAPAGWTVELDVPQDQTVDGLATPPVKDVVVRLPRGTVVSPSASDGLRTCPAAAMKLATSEVPDCPAASKIGSVQIDTPLLARPMTGSVFLLDQTPQRLLRMVLVAEGAGVRLKLPGEIDLDPVSGQVTATFANNPQLPFNHLTVALKGGPRAPLANPRACGPASTSTALTPWGGGRPAVSTDTVEIACDGAPSGFAPAFSAGSASTQAGAASAFSLTFARTDGDDLLKAIDVTMPAGLMPRLASTPLCGEAQAAAGSCGEASRIGSAQTSAGPGSLPFELPGRVYVTGPYKGAPYGLSIVVPAKAGPFDLGTVVVRAAVFVDLRTAALRIASDPLPTILQGIPLQIRSVRVAIDKPGFMLNPTSCAPRTVGAAIAAAGGAVAQRSSRYQVGGCRSLAYTPKLAVRVGARGQTRAGRRTSLVATLTQPAAQAANRSVRLALPKVLNARLDVVERACTQAAYDAGTCGAAARIGSATAVTPLLPKSLSGPAYFVRNPARRLPDIVVQLRGDVAIDLVGRVVITRDLRLTTTFDRIPDVPLSRFQLTLPASSGPVGVVRDLCTKAARLARARQGLRAQNGRLLRRADRLTIAGCAKQKK
ncbi:hypothetical protein VSS74_09690 [Conexibacter stalactiti]|uniref:Uncharacterized protein n=1 Tax=Conexibacter stalactiti TaxID=1940611 RepID=A0ABU4HMV4_9ACTN|nr:hypothetical protein [Conexibacter stalactiti]MDW5594609.1 hypothetical protein [Conexibacter stalactiti]MEC5035251.1 hypothetical protein [Conexibacter stalactiti]